MEYELGSSAVLACAPTTNRTDFTHQLTWLTRAGAACSPVAREC